ncbi:MAG: AraC family transcriptional regulator [Pedobacter sp.]|nr:MAG: AraC family transcriptional regulator [Pedobacter sp.]
MKKQHNVGRLKSINEIHDVCGFPKPKHPLISFSHIDKVVTAVENELRYSGVMDFYKITFVLKNRGRVKYGQDYYDFDEGSMMFLAPNQVVGSLEYSGSAEWYVFLIHPDFLLGSSLAKKIKQYGFFSYSANEALHLSEKEKDIIIAIFHIIEAELNERIDNFSQEVMLSQIDLLLNYANRFYNRQFITRKITNKNILQQTEAVLDEYFIQEKSQDRGLPSVHYLSEKLNVSPGYLSDMLRSLIGQNAQQYIHGKLIEKAKEKLTTTEMAVNEIAYELGFEHSQSFSKLFKSKTKLTPLEFRASFN